jgi:hypothetical protein
MRKLKIRFSKKSKPLLTLTRSHWSDRMVYILAANKHFPYKNKKTTVGRSKILYIGTTKRGAGRPAASAVSKASEVFYHTHGVRTIEVHAVTSAAHHKKFIWKRLEAALLDAFWRRYLNLPKYNKVRPRPVEGLFGANALLKIIAQFEPK